jgi:uncharacterized protein Yka (UPF0111/DUF47 family)
MRITIMPNDRSKDKPKMSPEQKTAVKGVFTALRQSPPESPRMTQEDFLELLGETLKPIRAMAGVIEKFTEKFTVALDELIGEVRALKASVEGLQSSEDRLTRLETAFEMLEFNQVKGEIEGRAL